MLGELLSHRCALTEFLDDPKALVLFEHLLDLGNDVIVVRGDEKPPRILTDCLVFAEGHLDRLEAIVVRALADEAVWRKIAAGVLGDLTQALVNLAEERLVRPARVSRSFRSSFSAIRGTLASHRLKGFRNRGIACWRARVQPRRA